MPRAEIPSKLALHALAKLYAELGGKLRRAKDKDRVRADIEHVAAVILLLDPAFDLSAIRPVERYRRNPLFRRGECFKLALDVLRRSERPLSSAEVATRLLQERGVAEPDRKQIAHMVGAVHKSFQNHEGKLVAVASGGRPKRWGLLLGSDDSPRPF